MLEDTDNSVEALTMPVSRNVPQVLLVTGALFAGATLTLSEAQACSWAEVILESSYPADGATDVPTNAVLFAYGPDLVSADDVELFDADGNTVPVDVRPVEPSGFDLIPLTELAPDQTYELRVPAESEEESAAIVVDAVTFTTGAGPTSAPEQLDAPELDVRVLEYVYGTCGSQSRICLDAPHPAGTTLEVRVGDEVLSPGNNRRAYNQPLLEGECVHVRVRDVLGNRSEPRTVCGTALQRTAVSSEFGNPESGASCDNYESFIEPGGDAGVPPGVADETTDAGPGEIDTDEPVGNAGGSSGVEAPTSNAAAGVVNDIGESNESDASVPSEPNDTETGTTEGTTGTRGISSSSATGGCATSPSGPIRATWAWLVCGVAALLTTRRGLRRMAQSLPR